MTDPTPTPDPTTVTPDPGPTVKDDDKTGFMVYDKTLKRFVGRKSDTAAAARETVVKVKGHRYETRAV